MRDLLDGVAPPVSVTVNERSSSPCFDAEYRASRRHTHACERRYGHTCSPANLLSRRTALEDEKAFFTVKEKTYWFRKIQDCVGNSRLLWRCLNTMMSADALSTRNDTSLTAQDLSNYFRDKIAEVRVDTLSCPPTFAGPCVSELRDFKECTMDEIRSIINQSPRKTCQLDSLPHLLLMPSNDAVLSVLCQICNNSLPEGMLPDCEKIAVITPILKKSDLDPDNVTNYRPISYLTYLSKLIERLVSSQLTTYLNETHLLAPWQSAYRVGFSIKIATLKIASDILDFADAGDVTIIALLDFSAAFDSFDHGILLQRLNLSYGICGSVLRWMQSFLSSRFQTVQFADKQSSCSTLTCRVPQGSILGPIMFTLYIADVIRTANSFGINIHCYADDMQLYVHCRAEESAAAVRRMLS